jgi:hypothetical protein
MASEPRWLALVIALTPRGTALRERFGRVAAHVNDLQRTVFLTGRFLMSQPSQGPGNQDEDPNVAEFHKRAGASHMEARKLLTAMAVGSIGVLYATLTGKDAPALPDSGKTLAILIIIAMGLSTTFGFAAWRADARWAHEVAEAYKHAKTKEEKATVFKSKAVKKWHNRKKARDRMQLAFFALGIAAAMLLTIAIILSK